MEPYKNPFNIPDEHMRMVGIIASHWEYIEQMLERAIAEIMELDEIRITILTANIGFQTKCDIILLHARPFTESDNPDDKIIWKKFTAAYEGLKQAQELRSKFVHAKWIEDKDNPEGPPLLNSVRTTGKKLTVLDDPAPIEKLYEAANTIKENGDAFVLLLQDFGLLK